MSTAEMHRLDEHTEEYAATIADYVVENDDMKTFVKQVYNFIEARTLNIKPKLIYSDNIFVSKEQTAELILKLIKSMRDAESADTHIQYSTGELAKYFGVSITAINKWICEGRFIGVEKKEKNKQIKISSTTEWRALTGQLYPVYEIVNDYKAREAQREENSKAKTERQMLLEAIEVFEHKYDKSFVERRQDTRGRKRCF